ncbi:MAG: type II toxin-antitoxin system RelE/ParE family toxin [Bacteroidota bacterium]
MATKKLKVIYKPRADRHIFEIMLYIAQKGYPDTAIQFYNELYNFGNSLVVFPEKYPISRHEKFRKRNLRCAPYKNYIFIYEVSGDKLVIYNVVHGRAIY